MPPLEVWSWTTFVAWFAFGGSLLLPWFVFREMAMHGRETDEQAREIAYLRAEVESLEQDFRALTAALVSRRSSQDEIGGSHV